MRGGTTDPRADESLLDKDNGPKRLSDEEQLALMRAELKQQRAESEESGQFGEKIEDLRPFNAEEFIEALFEHEA